MRSILIVLVICLVFLGCSGQIPKDTFVMKIPKANYNNGHRLHKLGLIYSTYPPYYSCIFCNNEISPYEFLPKQYSGINGYGKFTDSLRRNKINDDDWFMNEWNKKDTSCISTEIAKNKSQSIYDTWVNSHRKGKYYIDKEHWMSTDGFIGGKNWAAGGSFNDSILLKDKWYKIVYDNHTKKIKQLQP